MHHDARLVGRVAFVPMTQRLRPPETQNESRRDDGIGVAKPALLDELLNTRVAAGVAHDGDAVAEIQAERVVRCARAEWAAVTRQVSVHLDEAGDHVESRRVDHTIPSRALKVASISGAVHR